MLVLVLLAPKLYLDCKYSSILNLKTGHFLEKSWHRGSTNTIDPPLCCVEVNPAQLMHLTENHKYSHIIQNLLEAKGSLEYFDQWSRRPSAAGGRPSTLCLFCKGRQSPSCLPCWAMQCWRCNFNDCGEEAESEPNRSQSISIVFGLKIICNWSTIPWIAKKEILDCDRILRFWKWPFRRLWASGCIVEAPRAWVGACPRLQTQNLSVGR